MWDLPRPGLEPVSPALAGRLSTTAPPGKPEMVIFKKKGKRKKDVKEINKDPRRAKRECLDTEISDRAVKVDTNRII